MNDEPTGGERHFTVTPPSPDTAVTFCAVVGRMVLAGTTTLQKSGALRAPNRKNTELVMLVWVQVCATGFPGLALGSGTSSAGTSMRWRGLVLEEPAQKSLGATVAVTCWQVVVRG